MIEIRPYKDKDYEQVKINLQEGGLFSKEIDTKEILKRKIEKNPKSILVAVVDKKIVGSAYVVEDYWQSFIFRLAVKKDYRNMGVGSALMKEAEKLIKKRGVKGISLAIDSGKNDLLNYYSKRGYEPNSKTHKFMWKNLDSNN